MLILVYVDDIIVTSTSTLVGNKAKYISDLLKKAKMDASNTCPTPTNSDQVLSKCEGDPIENSEEYRPLLGSLQYLTMTRPHIAFAINKLCQFMHAPSTLHWKALKRLLRYLRYTPSLGVFFSKNSSLAFQCFSDVD